MDPNVGEALSRVVPEENETFSLFFALDNGPPREGWPRIGRKLQPKGVKVAVTESYDGSQASKISDQTAAQSSLQPEVLDWRVGDVNDGRWKMGVLRKKID